MPHHSTAPAFDREAVDREALARARPAAIAETRALLGVLLNPEAGSAELARRARAAYEATGLLWERAARIAQ